MSLNVFDVLCTERDEEEENESEDENEG